MRIPSKTEKTFSPGEGEIRQLLDMLQLGDGDLSLYSDYRELVEPFLDVIVTDFYAYMLSQDVFRGILIGGGYDVEALKKTQKAYLITLGKDFNTAGYFESRIMIGKMHERVGVSLSLYQCAMRYLQQRILGCICSVMTDREQQRVLLEWLLKVVALDTTLVIEAYHGGKLDDLRFTLEHMTRVSDGLKKRIDTDPLTQTISRQTIIEIAEEILMAQASVSERPCFAMLDIDLFKQVNDTHGHLAGDVVLAEVADRIMTVLRGSDLVGRFGGEEFLLVLEETSMHDAAHVCERIRRQVADSPVSTEDDGIAVTVSIGLAKARSGESLDDVIKRADKCLYQAKENGRNRLVTESSEPV